MAIMNQVSPLHGEILTTMKSIKLIKITLVKFSYQYGGILKINSKK